LVSSGDSPGVQPDAAAPTAGIKAKAASGVGLASLLSAAAGIIILFIASRALSLEDNAQFLSFWAAFFFIYGILGGIQIESTRAVRAGLLSGQTGSRRGARILPTALLIGGAVALGVVALGPLLGAFIFPHNPVVIVAALAISAVMYACHCAQAGSVQGQGAWSTLAQMVSFESVLRMAAIAVAALLSAPLIGIELAVLVTVVVWPLMLLLSAPSRRAATARADVPARRLLYNTGHAMLSAGSSAALVVGFPILVNISSTPEEYAQAAPLLLAISMTRAPIMIPLQAFQGVAITAVMQPGGRGWRALLRPVGLLTAIGLLGAVLAAWIGPALMMLVFGPDYYVDGWVLGALMIAAVLIAVLTLSGTAAMAVGKHRAFSSGWLLATALALGLLWLPASIEVRSILSLTVGPLLGIAVHAAAIGSRPKALVPAA
jgi:O-antigen/teichoic acid export membrane protein